MDGIGRTHDFLRDDFLVQRHDNRSNVEWRRTENVRQDNDERELDRFQSSSVKEMIGSVVLTWFGVVHAHRTGTSL